MKTVFKSFVLSAILVFLAACSDSDGLFEERSTEKTSGNADAVTNAVDSGTYQNEQINAVGLTPLNGLSWTPVVG